MANLDDKAEEVAVAQRLQGVSDSGQGMERLSEAFESSARRWELIVYPSLFAFVVLAAYGFFLIYRLSADVHYLAISVDTHMSLLSSNMQSMSENMDQLTTNVRTMTVSLDSMDGKISNLEPIMANMSSMDQSMRAMTTSTSYMQHDISRLNTNIGRPMSFMNNMMPW